MKILMIGQKGIPARYGGIERHVEELSFELAKLGHEVLVYSRAWYSPKKSATHRGIKIVHTPTIRTKHLDAITHTFTSTIHALFQKPDVIHYHGVGPALLSWIPRLLLPSAKVIVTFHCIDRYHKKWNAFARLILGIGEKAACLFPHNTITVSEFLKNYCLNEYGTVAAHIPSGARAPLLTNPDILSKWGLTPNRYVFMAARLIKLKGAHYLIDAWKQARHLAPAIFADYKLVIAGGGVFDDDYVKSLHVAAAEEKSIVFTGWADGKKIDALFNHATMLIHPSESEGLPLTVLTAMAAGKPVLASDITAHQELIPDSNFRFTNANVNALTKKLINAMENPDKLNTAGKDNRTLADTNYNWEKIANTTANVYELMTKK